MHQVPEPDDHPCDDDHAKGYDLAPEDPDPRTPAPPPARSDARAGQRTDRARPRGTGGSHEDDSDEDGEKDGEKESEKDGDEEGEGSLPPPISRPGDPRPWLLAAGAAVLLLCISWLAGAPQLVLPETASDGSAIVRELGIAERFGGLARTLVYLPLATLGGVFGLLVLAFVRQRPVGDVPALFARVAALAAAAMLLWLVPSDIRFLKQLLNLVGVPLAAGLLAMPVLRLGIKDALLAATYTLLGMLLLVLASATVIWAVGR